MPIALPGCRGGATGEWLQSWGDDDYEPSGLMTPRDRAELERRKAAHLSAVSAAPGADKAGDAENPAAVASS